MQTGGYNNVINLKKNVIWPSAQLLHQKQRSQFQEKIISSGCGFEVYVSSIVSHQGTRRLTVFFIVTVIVTLMVK